MCFLSRVVTHPYPALHEQLVRSTAASQTVIVASCDRLLKALACKTNARKSELNSFADALTDVACVTNVPRLTKTPSCLARLVPIPWVRFSGSETASSQRVI